MYAVPVSSGGEHPRPTPSWVQHTRDLGSPAEALLRGHEEGRGEWMPQFCKDAVCSCEEDDSCYSTVNCYDLSPTIATLLSRKASLPVVESFDRYSRGDYDFGRCSVGQTECQVHVPVAVMSLEADGGRKAHMSNMLAKFGFTRVSFPSSISLRSQDLDLEDIADKGYISFEAVAAFMANPWIGKARVKADVGNAIGHLNSVEEGIRAHHPHFIVMEDHIMPTAEPEEIRTRILAAIAELPDTADMLYLEMCFESCRELCGVRNETTLLINSNFARARRPKCSGAILYTAKGAREVLRQCRPIFGAIDNMFPVLIERGLLEAYAMTPPLFAQDSFFEPSPARYAPFLPNVGREEHVPALPVCKESRHLQYLWHEASAAEMHVCACRSKCSCAWEDADSGWRDRRNRRYGDVSSSQDLMDRFPRGSAILAGITHSVAVTSEVNLDQDSMDFPVFVISDPKEASRRVQLDRVLRELGLNRVTHPPFLGDSDINVDGLLGSGRLSVRSLEQLQSVPWVGQAWRKVLSLVLNHLRCLELGIESGSDLFAVFEDDLMLIASPAEAKQRLRRSLEEFPATADLLYLEFCYETCSNLTFYHRFQHIVPAVEPACTAAMLFSKHGALKILREMRPVFLPLDNMYQALISSGRLEAFLMTPPVVLQDGFWASSMRSTGARSVHSSALPGRTHRPFGALCREHQVSPWVMATLQLAPESVGNSRQTPDNFSDEAIVVVSSDEFVAPSWHEAFWDDILSTDSIATYYTKPRPGTSCTETGGEDEYQDFCIRIGVCNLQALAGSVTLTIPQQSMCWHDFPSCTILVQVVGRSGDISVVERIVTLSRRMMSLQPPQHAVIVALLPSSSHRSLFSAPSLRVDQRPSAMQVAEVVLFELGEADGPLEQLHRLTSVPVLNFDYVALMGSASPAAALPGLPELLQIWRPLLGLAGRFQAGWFTAELDSSSAVVWVVSGEELNRLQRLGGLSSDMEPGKLFAALADQLRSLPSGFAWRLVPLSGTYDFRAAPASLHAIEAEPLKSRRAVFSVLGDLRCSVGLLALVADEKVPAQAQELLADSSPHNSGSARERSSEKRMETGRERIGVEVRDCSGTLEGNKTSGCWDIHADESRRWMANRDKLRVIVSALTAANVQADHGAIVDAGSGMQALLEILAEAEGLAQLTYVPVDLEEVVADSGTRVCDLNSGEFPLLLGDRVVAFVLSGVMEYVLDKLTVLRMCRKHAGAVVAMHYMAGCQSSQRGMPYRWVAQHDVFGISQLALHAGFALRVFHRTSAEDMRAVEMTVEEADKMDDVRKHGGLVFLFSPLQDDRGSQPQQIGGKDGVKTSSEAPAPVRRQLAGGVHAVWAHPCSIPEKVLAELRSLLVELEGSSNALTLHCGNSHCMQQAATMAIAAKRLNMRTLTQGTPFAKTFFQHATYLKLLLKQGFSHLLQEVAILCLAHQIQETSCVMDLAKLNASVHAQWAQRQHDWVAVVHGSSGDTDGSWRVVGCNLSPEVAHGLLPRWSANLAQQLPVPPLDKVHDKQGGIPPSAPYHSDSLLRYLALQRARAYAHARGVRVRMLIMGTDEVVQNDRPCSHVERGHAVMHYDWRVQTGGGSNVGDEMQSLAALQAMPEVDVLVDRDRQRSTASKVLYFANGWYGDRQLEWPPGNSSSPILLSLHIDAGVRSQLSSAESLAFLRQHAPVGARDEDSLEWLRSQGVEAFMSACMTLLLRIPLPPPREPGLVLLVDVDPTLLELVVPAAIRNSARRIFHYLDPPDHHPHDSLARFEVAYAHLHLLSRAVLVITARIHAALPCVGLQTPVVFLVDEAGVAPGLGTSPQRGHGLLQLFHSFRVVRGAPLPPGLASFDWNNPPPNPRPEVSLQYQRVLWERIREHKSLRDTAELFDLWPGLLGAEAESKKGQVDSPEELAKADDAEESGADSHCFPRDFLAFHLPATCGDSDATTTSLTLCTPDSEAHSQAEMACTPLEDLDRGHWVLEYQESHGVIVLDDFQGGELRVHLTRNDPNSDLLRLRGAVGRRRTAVWVQLLRDTCSRSRSQVVVDAACGLGYHALLALAHGCHVVCFEPDPLLVGHLVRSVRANRFKASIVIVLAAVGGANSSIEFQSCSFRQWKLLDLNLPIDRVNAITGYLASQKDSFVEVVEMGALLHGRAAALKMDVDGGCDGTAVNALEPWLSKFGFENLVAEASGTIDDQLIERFTPGCNGTLEGLAWVEHWEMGMEYAWRDWWVTKFRAGHVPYGANDIMLKCYGGGTGKMGRHALSSRQGWSPVQCYDVVCSCEENDSCWPMSSCVVEHNRTLSFMMDRWAMIQVVESMHRYFRGDYRRKSCPSNHTACGLEFPVAVMNLPWQTSRRVQMETMLDELGFSQVSFPAAGRVLGKDIVLEELIEHGWITTEAVESMTETPWVGETGLRAYVANAIGQLEAIAKGLRAGHPYFIVMEDDVVASADPASTRSRISAAVQELPQTADMLYLEMCFESCGELCPLPNKTHIARARRPKCTGAILYTSKGAARVLELCKPIFMAIDNMFPILIERGMLEAYTMAPPAFVQDSFFGSSVVRLAGTELPMIRAGMHFPVAPICQESEHRWGMQAFSLAYALEVGQKEKETEYLLSTMGVGGLPLSQQCQSRRMLFHLLWREVVCESQCSIRNFVVRGRQLTNRQCVLFESLASGEDSVVRDGGEESRTGERAVFEMLDPGANATFSEGGGQEYELYLATKHIARPTLVHSLLGAEQRDICFLVHSPQPVDTQLLSRFSSAIVSLVWAPPQPPAAQLGVVLYRPSSSIEEQRKALLEKALEDFSLPLVMFQWFVWCDGDAVSDGRCAAAARQLVEAEAETPPRAGFGKELLEPVAAVSWRRCQQALREGLAGGG